eukprot:m.114544 g.114544  ORF g.114544 m.114544 type:complete len:276 (-) comp14171_c0_seq3:117-944(-)
MNDTAAALGGMGTAVTMNPNSSRKSKKIRKVSHSVLSAATAGSAGGGAKKKGKEIKGITRVESVKSKKPDNKNDDDDGDYVLQSIFSKGPVHSAVRHDAALERGPSDYVLVEKEAHRVAKAARDALAASERALQDVPIGTPVWTGRFGTTGAHARFGKARGFAGTSSQTLLSQIRERTVGQGVSKKINGIFELRNVYQATSSSAKFEMGLLKSLKDYLKQRGGKASTDSILKAFEKKVAKEHSALFSALLRSICTLQKRPGKSGVWELNAEENSQ